MNAIFCTVFISSAIILCIVSPDSFLSSLLTGSLNAAKCALTLFCIYAVWLGLSAVAEDAGISKGLARLMKPVCKKIFKSDNEQALQNISMNLSCNLLGIGGAATPFAVKAIKELESEHNAYAQNMLFIINATSVQIIPTTVIALRVAFGSVNASDIVLPSLLATALSTALAAGLYATINKFAKKKRKWLT
jgi:spore maturation protein A